MFATRDQRRGQAGIVDVAFTNRHGGVSSPPYDSLDLSQSAERSADVAENLSRVAAAFGVDTLHMMRQVHGNTVAVAEDHGHLPECDGLVTDRAGMALCVRAADCVPVVLADPDRGVVAVAHAGRGGIVKQVVGATVARMRQRNAERIAGWIGPHICGGCYEVPAQMRADVASEVPTSYACTTWGTPSLDLGAAVHAQLAAAGVEPVTDLALCTRQSPDLYSHRRDGSDAGRFAGLVVLRTAAG